MRPPVNSFSWPQLAGMKPAGTVNEPYFNLAVVGQGCGRRINFND
jgi:hypothetical protein